MKEKSFIFTILAIAIFITGGIIGYLFRGHQLQSQLLPSVIKEVKENPIFLMGDNLSCQILYSTNKDDVGKNISLLNLFSNDPKFLSPDGGTFPLKKVYETEDTLTMLWVATGSGSIDAIVLDKTTGIFSRVSAGSFLRVYAVASKGNCK